MKKQLLHKVLNVVAYILIGILFLVSIVGIVIKINKGTIYLFNTRGDIVLSNSMSYKNEKYADFLEGHDDQIDKMDLVFSKKVDKTTELNVYDIVLFDNPGVGTTMHRIVGKEQLSIDTLSLIEANIGTYKEQEVINLPTLASLVETSAIGFKEAEVTIISDKEYEDVFAYGVNNILMEKSVSTEKVDDYYRHTVSLKRNSSAPGKFRITFSNYCDYSSYHISNINISAENGTINATAYLFSKNEDGTYSYSTNRMYEYEIRGDAAPDSDGKFTIDDIYSKVTFVIPKLGGFVRFSTSVFGIILYAGIGAIIIVASIFWDRINKKEKQITTNEKADEKDETK